MKNLITTGLFLLSTFALSAPTLVTGDYGVSVKDRRGKVHHCTLEVENNTDHLLLSINDCPPKLDRIALFPYEDETIFVSDKINVDTPRGGYKMYEIKPLATNRFEMTSFREYSNGGVGKPRKVMATLK